MKRMTSPLIALLLITLAGVTIASAAHDTINESAGSQTEGSKSVARTKSAAKVTMKEARATALAQVPGGRIKSSELERENGQLLYSFDIRTRNGIKEVHVDALTGKVLEVKSESAANEASEHRNERRESKRRP